MKKRKKKLKPKNIDYIINPDNYKNMGDYQDAIIARDKKYKKDQEKKLVKHYKEQKSRGRTIRVSLLKIQKEKESICQVCGKKKSIEEFYTYYNDLKELIKIWPNCKICDRKKYHSHTLILLKKKRELCIKHYAKSNKPRCSLCKNSDIDSLVLFNKTVINNSSIITDRTYNRLYNFKFPDIKYSILCYNCAYNQIHKNH